MIGEDAATKRIPAFSAMRHVPTASLATLWAYASHKYDCFNVGPCRGDAEIWIDLHTLGYCGFLGMWGVLVASAAFGQSRTWRQGVRDVLLALLLPPASFFLASAIFNDAVVAAKI